MKAIHPIAKGKAEIELQRIEKFKIEFVNTQAYEDLNTQFPIFEIFEMNNGKFEIETVQQAFESFIKELKPKKRIEFSKNLDHLIDGKHAVIPSELTWEQLQTLSDDPQFFEYWQAACSGDSGEDCACLAIQAIHKALIDNFKGAAQ